jgi:hypothetical protein
MRWPFEVGSDVEDEVVDGEGVYDEGAHDKISVNEN